MKIYVSTYSNDGKKVTTEINSDKQIDIEIDPNCGDILEPGQGNGFLGPECLIQALYDNAKKTAHQEGPECVVQMFGNGPHLVGFRIIPEPGRDDTKYTKIL